MSSTRRPFIIAEVGQAHDGSLGILHSYIDAVAATGVDAIKFQTHIADAESSEHEPFRVDFSYVDATRQDYWRRMEFTAEQWAGIKRHCEAAKIEFFSTPTCVAAVDLLERIGVGRYKVGSGDTDNRLLLERVARTGRQVILSSGLSTFEELDATVSFVAGHGNEVVVMQCTSEYPVVPERLGLNLIPEFLARYRHPVGLSDHSGSIYPPLAAVAQGATYVESHVVFDRRMFGPDSASSITIDELRAMVDGIRLIDTSLRSQFTKDLSPERRKVRDMFGKSLCVSRPMLAGDTLNARDLESKKPAGLGVPARSVETVLGKRLTRDMAQWQFLTEADFK
jgi:N,N'-diacetyllegionaminate synthase